MYTLYLCICVCVFACQTPGNIISNIPVPSGFQKYSTCMVHSGSDSIVRDLDGSGGGHMPIIVAKCHRYGRYICAKMLLTRNQGFLESSAGPFLGSVKKYSFF